MKDNLLWLPDSAKELLCVDSDEVEDIDTMLFINQSTTDWLNGELDTGTFTDILLEYDVNPNRINDAENLLEILLR